MVEQVRSPMVHDICEPTTNGRQYGIISKVVLTTLATLWGFFSMPLMCYHAVRYVRTEDNASRDAHCRSAIWHIAGGPFTRYEDPDALARYSATEQIYEQMTEEERAIFSSEGLRAVIRKSRADERRAKEQQLTEQRSDAHKAL